MIRGYNKLKIILIAILVVAISFLHYITKMGQLYYHIFYRELYFLPLILGGFWFGFRGGVITSLGITILYLPTLFMHWQGFSPDDFDKILEIMLFNIIGPGLGFFRDREKAHEKAKIEAEHMAKEQAESASRLKSDFLSLVSHELRTPLISIIGYNDLLLDGVAGSLNAEQIDALRKIDNNSKRLLELINGMLDLSRHEANVAELKEIEISQFMEEIKNEHKSLFESSGLDFIWIIDPELQSIRTDPGRLKVILINLFSNAVKFTEKGNVTIDVHKRDNGVEFSVTDTGIGIAPEAFQNIFEPFRQVENPLTRQHGGAGLGLYIVKRFVELLSGTIKVESEVGKGSTFRVSIPTG